MVNFNHFNRDECFDLTLGLHLMKSNLLSRHSHGKTSCYALKKQAGHRLPAMKTTSADIIIGLALGKEGPDPVQFFHLILHYAGNLAD